MTDLRQETVDTYNNSAKELSEYFQGIGPRSDDIAEALQLAGNPELPRIIEIGCGDGRDAQEIVQYAGFYQGFDISEGLIQIAQEHVPKGEFLVADAVTFEYPPNLDVVFAFASLLHLDKDEFKAVLDKVASSLKPGGIFYISLKHRPEYTEEIKEDKFGRRQFYFYNSNVVSHLALDRYQVIKDGVEHRGDTDWLEIALKRA